MHNEVPRFEYTSVMSEDSARCAQHDLKANGPDWWRAWDVRALKAACAGVPDDELTHWPDVARWRAIAGLMEEGDETLACLEIAYTGHMMRGDAAAANVDAHIALVCCVINIGTMDGVTGWLERARTAPPIDPHDPHAVWLFGGVVARAVLGNEAMTESTEAAHWLHGRLGLLNASATPDERLLYAQVLANFHVNRGEFETFDLLANAVGAPALFGAASPIMQTRWLHWLGWAHYSVDQSDRAELEWQRSLALAEASDLAHMRLLNSLALLRLLIDRGRIEHARRIEASIRPDWGAGRHVQLMYLKQLRARLLLIDGQPVRAMSTLDEAFALADRVQLSASERASCQTDLAQALFAADRLDEADALLKSLSAEHEGRDGQVFRCLYDLLSALRSRSNDANASRAYLAAGLQRARESRYTMFFRLLPQTASTLCALAMRWGIEAAFVREVVRSRELPAPDQADEYWPWVVYLRMLGTFDLRLRGVAEAHKRSRKLQRKPIELLCALACQPGMAWGAGQAADALWPEADGDLARKSLDMAVKRLRELLGDADHTLVAFADGRLMLDSRRVSADLVHRRSLVKHLEAIAMSPDAKPTILATTRRIVELGAGPLLR
jgi:hypothetical protein